MNYPQVIRNLIESYKKLPGIGEKTAERYALATLNLDDDTLNLFSSSLKDLKTKIKKCSKCNSLTEDELCEICKDKKRNKKILCVVEEAKNVILFEKIGIYNGLYFVLEGLISPLEGIDPEKIKMTQLLERIKEEKIEEVIIAVKPSIEGETTALYITRMLKDAKVKISKIAHGVPLGAEMEYLDSMTLEVALENRNVISE